MGVSGKRSDVEFREIFAEPAAFADKEITVYGWVRTNRNSNKFGFMQINDGTAFDSIQIVYEQENIDNFADVTKMSVAAAVKVTGVLELTPEAKQPFEIKARSVVLEADSGSDRG